jgi:hypothetical protein
VPLIDRFGRQKFTRGFFQCIKRFFPSKNKLPDTLLFSKPQYNTWIELVYNQNQKDILSYARAIIDNGFPTGVIMIDDNWADYYGRLILGATGLAMLPLW